MNVFVFLHVSMFVCVTLDVCCVFVFGWRSFVFKV